MAGAAVADLALQPPLKWAGGKRWLVPHLRPFWANHHTRRLVEPFCGGLAVTLGLRPDRALIHDANPHLMRFYRWLRRGLVIQIPMENDQHLYYAHRARFNELIATGHAGTREAASLFYYLNRTGFNGLCRFNRSGRFNVPFGRHRQIAYRRDFRQYQPILACWELREGPFETLKVAPDDFLYADPPYDVEFVGYSKDGFTWEDQVRLAGWLARHPGPVIASNQATTRILQLYRDHGFTISTLSAPRRINNTGDRTPALELLAVRNL